MILLYVALTVSIILNIVAGFSLYKLIRRVLDLDELFELLLDDIEINVEYFNKLLMTPLFDNSQEVKTANHNMMIISKRLTEFALRIKEKTNKGSDELQPVE